jgi:hypothetical protein
VIGKCSHSQLLPFGPQNPIPGAALRSWASLESPLARPVVSWEALSDAASN